MPRLNLIVKRKKDKTPAVNKPVFMELRIDDCVILEGGMASGSPSISFGMYDQHGNYYIAQTSFAILDTITHAVKGAQDHWRENP